MIRIKQDPDALDLTNRPQQHLLSPTIDHEDDDDDDENFSTEDDTHDCLPKKTTYDSGFVDTSDVNNSSIMVKQEQNHHHHYHSTPLRPQQIHSHIRHPSTSSSTCSSPTRQEQSNDKECRNTRFLGSRAVAILNQWFQSNRDYPYPDDERTEQLANEAGITQKQVKKWFANKRVRSQMCYKPLYRSRKPRNSTSTIPERQTQTNYNYIINHNNIATPPTNSMLFNPMATSMMMFMMQQHFLTSMMTGGFSQAPIAPPPPPPPQPSITNTRKPNVDRITRFWL
ncbi:unnamed protein product [Rotaria sp. Silwood2]|nr:unnamed protein product [Rotaria sp. Silwood2]CAF2930712.1 unnamed protein product [Rotaria sp. Silwood2]CAF4337585.1 unnamed protein product [Rotaria sp. Silwood2]CAF4514631.1 unnamed protein product [Rotaria sp. Silwood2]